MISETSIETPEQTANYNKFMAVLKNKSATVLFNGEPGTVILYSGEDPEFGASNLRVARKCTEKVSNSYTIHDTEVGKYADNVIQSAFRENKITDPQRHELWDQASKMLVNQAKGPALAVTRGAVNLDSTFMRIEMREILEGRTGITAINGIPVQGMKFGELANPSVGNTTLKVLGTAEECKPAEAKQPMNYLDKVMMLNRIMLQQNLPDMPHGNYPSQEERDLFYPKSAPLSAPGFWAPGLLVNNSQQDHQLHNIVANDPALAQRIADATASLKDSGVDLQQAGQDISAPHIRSETAISRGAGAMMV